MTYILPQDIERFRAKLRCDLRKVLRHTTCVEVSRLSGVSGVTIKAFADGKERLKVETLAMIGAALIQIDCRRIKDQ